MIRAEITREGVLKAIAEHDELGRSTFLQRYGFNGARDYFLVYETKNYDSKAIAAVAHKWAPGGNGRPLSALELSGGKADAAKKLLELGFTVTSPGQNADWTHDEHVLALDLYMTNPASPPGKESREVRELSALLNAFGRRSGLAMTEKFRNANGVYMKMMNFRRLDPRFQAQGKAGLARGAKGEEEVWARYANDLGSLRAAAAAIKAQFLGELGDTDLDSNDPDWGDVAAFDIAWTRFKELIIANGKGHPFTRFTEGIAGAWENYKPRLRDHARGLMAADDWDPADVGTGKIIDRIIDGIEIQDSRSNQVNNLVFWQNRYGHANRDHRAIIEARADPKLCRPIERLLFDLFRGETDEGLIFDRLSELTGAKYPLLAYLFFLKDMDRFMPIQPTTFDRAFRALNIDLVTLRHCEWSNYTAYNSALERLRKLIETRTDQSDVRLIDAHSFCWMLEQLPDGRESKNGGRSRDAGRIIGGREKAIIAMRYSIEQTTRNSNGQTAQKVVKNKDLKMSSMELERLLATLLDIQGNRCALTGIPFRFDQLEPDKNFLPSADRIDSSGHYELGNLQIVCRFVNFWKRDMENAEFKRLLMVVQGVEPS